MNYTEECRRTNKYLDMTPEERREKRQAALIFWRLHRKSNKQAAQQYRRQIQQINEAERMVFEGIPKEMRA